MGEQPDLTGMSNMPRDDELSSPPRPLLHRRKKVWLLGIVVTKLFHFPLAGIHLSHGTEDHISHTMSTALRITFSTAMSTALRSAFPFLCTPL